MPAAWAPEMTGFERVQRNEELRQLCRWLICAGLMLRKPLKLAAAAMMGEEGEFFQCVEYEAELSGGRGLEQGPQLGAHASLSPPPPTHLEIPSPPLY